MYLRRLQDFSCNTTLMGLSFSNQAFLFFSGYPSLLRTLPGLTFSLSSKLLPLSSFSLA